MKLFEIETIMKLFRYFNRDFGEKIDDDDGNFINVKENNKIWNE